MILYHYTSAPNLRPIAKHGLTIGDVPTDLRRSLGRVGVWLTTSPNQTGHGLSRGDIGPARYRLMLDLPLQPPLVRWSEWAPNNVTLETINNLKECAKKDGDSQWKTWYIYFGAISTSKIMTCHDIETGQPVEDWGDVWPIELDAKGVAASRRHTWHDRLMKCSRRGMRAMEARGIEVVY